jgi:ABC-2 type transport system ATP-binding protein
MIIEVDQLSKTYSVRAGRKRVLVRAVAGIDLGVKNGEIFGLLGPNGAGKTTTFHMLATLIPPDSGRAAIAGADLRRHPHEVRRRLGYVSQRGGTSPDVTAREELVMHARMYGLSKAEAVRRAARLLGDFQLTELAGRRTRTYSGGQRRRVDLACGVIHGPAVLLLDEPSAGLDPASRAVLWGEIRRLREAGATVVISTHYLDEADALCDRLAIMDQGRIVATGTPEELKAMVAGDVVALTVVDPATAAARSLHGNRHVQQMDLGGDHDLRLYVDHGPTAIPSIMRTLQSAGIGIASLNLHQPCLDDVFLDRTGRSLQDAPTPGGPR